MFKRLLLLAAMVLVFSISVSADWPLPPCLPDCPTSAVR